MNSKEIENAISKGVSVSRQDVMLAKSFILSHFNRDSLEMLRRFLEHVEVKKLTEFVIHGSVPAEPQIKQVTDSFRWQLAFAEGVWGLLGAGLLLPCARDSRVIEARQAWTTVVPGTGGMSSGWHFAEFDVAIPAFFRLAPTISDPKKLALSDADLFIHELGTVEMAPDVEQALRQAVECFRNDLYLPCLVMLGMASEGAWVELGMSLLRVDPNHPSFTAEARKKIRDALSSPYTSVLAKMEKVVELYNRRDIYENVVKRCGQNQRRLNEVFNWSNVIRDSRNAIHYGSETAVRNSYEKVAALLLGAAQYLQILSLIKKGAEQCS